MNSARLCLGLITLTSCLAFSACGDDAETPAGSAGESASGGTPAAGGGSDAGGSSAGQGTMPHPEASIECQVVGRLCHDADTGSGTASDCHDVGHEGNAEACHEAFAGCIGFCVEGSGAGGAAAGGAAGTGTDPYCAALGALCHDADDGDGPLSECHDVGHEGNPAACAAAFDECATACLAVPHDEPPSEGGAGGVAAGGAPSGVAGQPSGGAN